MNNCVGYGCLGTGISEAGKTARLLIVAPIAILGALIVVIMVVKMSKSKQKGEGE